MTHSLIESLDDMPAAAVLMTLTRKTKEMVKGIDPTIAAVKVHADALGARIVLVGGVAVIAHGYRRTTDDRDLLVDRRRAKELAERLMNDADWDRLETAEYAFLHRHTGIKVDFLVSGDLIQLGRPYLFPDPANVEVGGEIEDVGVVGLHELLFLKLLSGRMKDLADVMELCKLHLDGIEPDRVLNRLQPEDTDLRQRFLDIVKQAPVELAAERRLGQQHRNH